MILLYLGQASFNPFKDLYLAGGIYLGDNTGTVNKLDDYETGTWTPELSFADDTTGITYVNREGIYTKVGRVVTAIMRVSLTSNGTATSGQCQISLPFTVGNILGTTSVQGTSNIGFIKGFNGSFYAVEGVPWEGFSYIKLYQRTSLTGHAQQTVGSSHISDAFDCRITVQFMTA